MLLNSYGLHDKHPVFSSILREDTIDELFENIKMLIAESTGVTQLQELT
jgi:hypothetical protein